MIQIKDFVFACLLFCQQTENSCHPTSKRGLVKEELILRPPIPQIVKASFVDFHYISSFSKNFYSLYHKCEDDLVLGGIIM